MSDLWVKARENAKAARLLLEAQCYNSACTRAYYAMFTAARCLLHECAGIELDALKRHATVLRLFSLHFVREGAFSED